jgi:simple sugar transport system permease protein
MNNHFRLADGALAIIMLAVLCILTGAMNPDFFSVATLFDTLRTLTIVGIFGMGVLLVMLSGGIDVSFPAIAALSAYAAVTICHAIDLQGPVIVIYAIAVLIGAFLGLINGALVTFFNLPALIVTLGTSSAFYGFNLFFLGSQNLFNVPKSLSAFSRDSLLKVTDAYDRTWSLHPMVLVFLAIVVLIALMLRFTTLGRGIYAVGGGREAALRVGMPVRRIELTVFGLAGALAALAGITQVVFFRNANPGAFAGSELDVIAAIVLGGVAVTGGRGTVLGAIAGLTFVVVMTTSLVMLGIPSAWQKFFVGSALLIGVSASAWQIKRTACRRPVPFSRMEMSDVS